MLILFILVSCQKPKIEPQYMINLRLNPDQQVNYTIEVNNTFLRSGTLESSWNDIDIPEKSGTYIIYYWNADYYVHKYYLSHDYYDKFDRTFTIELKLQEDSRKGAMSVSLYPEIIKDQAQYSNLIFTANGTVKKFAVCIYASVGFIYAEPQRDVSVCETYYWTNHSVFGNTTKGTWYCDYLTMPCKWAEGMECKNERLPVPPSLYADACFFTGKTVRNANFTLPMYFKTMPYYDNSDILKIYVMDMDLSPNTRILGKEWGYGFNQPVFIGEVR